MSNDPFAQLKVAARDGWSMFAPLEAVTTMPAARLAKFAGIKRGDRVLDAACGTGVVAVTAASRGAHAHGLDLTPTLLARARENAALAGVEIPFVEGNVEALPYEDASFDVVVSQFGHMFAPRPEVAVAELLRVLRPGGTLAFSTWPNDGVVGMVFAIVGKHMPLPPGAATPTSWGDPTVIRERLAGRVSELFFELDMMRFPALSVAHYRATLEATGPLGRASERLDAASLAALRKEIEDLAASYFTDNTVMQQYRMTRARKLG